MFHKTTPKIGDKVRMLKKRDNNQEIPAGLIGTITIVTNYPCDSNMILVEFDECVDGYMDDNCWWFPSKRWYNHFEVIENLTVELI